MTAQRRRDSKRSSGLTGGSTGGWEIIYTGFVMILLCFFIMLASFATLEKAKLVHVAQSFEASLRLLPGGQGVLPAMIAAGKGPAAAAGSSEVEQLFALLMPLFRDHSAASQISLVRTHSGPVMRLADQALFTSGSADLGPEPRRLLKKLAETIAPTDWSLRIEGHTDDRPINSERYPSNWELSTARAVSVLRFLEEGGALHSSRLAAAGFGEQRPIGPNGSARQRAKNRRVEILFRQGMAGSLPAGRQP